MPPDASRLPPVEAGLFREAMSRVCSPVHLVTTAGPAGQGGFTCTAFASVSDAPPMVMACLNRRSRSAGLFRENGCFAVNTLSEADRPLADVFSGLKAATPEERFPPGRWRDGASGAPLLQGALASLGCRLVSVTDLGSHQLMVGEVVEVLTGDAEAAPLFYHRRGYRGLA